MGITCSFLASWFVPKGHCLGLSRLGAGGAVMFPSLLPKLLEQASQAGL